MLEPKIVYRLSDNTKDSSTAGKYTENESGGTGWSALMQCAIEEEKRPLDIYDAPLCNISFISKSGQSTGIVGHLPPNAGIYTSYPWNYNAAGPSESNTMNQNMVASRPKKRKASTFSQSPWRKVVLQGSESCHSISSSEQNWALATNTLCEKVDPNDSTSKKRLLLSTHFMQQLIQPAPAFALSGAFNYEIMLYFVSRITLADACSLKCHSDSNKSTNLQTSITASNDQDQHYSSLVKAFMEKTQKLESDFQRLEITTSIVDIFLEIQHLERFSVLNHLAKFHRTKNTTRSVPRRYVIVGLGMPKNLPEPLHCLPL